MLNRGAGLLLNVSSLPNYFGIGGFGEEINTLCEYLKKGGFTYWQILPLVSIGLGNSPYMSESSFSINPLYVDPISLLNEGLVSQADVDSAKFNCETYVVDYDVVKEKKHLLLVSAYNNFKNNIDKLKPFIRKNAWVKEYAEFMMLKELNNFKPWYEWDNSIKYYDKNTVKKIVLDNIDIYNFYIFEQYILDSQWKNVKKICKDNKIQIIGDMPIYVSLDSVDVWANRDEFLLDKNGKPKKVAGVPPDYFSEDGQLWGNPLYNYSFMRKNNFTWWMNRFDRMLSLYDILRIDHFRAFSQYWAVDAKETTAKNGKWCKGVGKELFNEVYKKYSNDRFIAEDLGIIDDKVRKLIKDVNLPGMRVFQFGFDSDTSIHLPANYTENVVAYTATHDNNTTLGWLYELDDNTRRKVLNLIDCDYSVWGRGSYDNESVKKCIKYVFNSKAIIAVAPFQDLCGFGSDCRMNTPGVAENNWKYRTTSDQMRDCLWSTYYEINKETKRIND